MTKKVKFSSYVHKNFKSSLDRLAKNNSKAEISYHSEYVTVKDYLENFNEKNLTAICFKISQLEYNCDPLTPILLPKVSNLKRSDMSLDNTRLVCVPSVQDRILQKLLISYLKKYYKKIYHKFCQYDHALNKDILEKEIEIFESSSKTRIEIVCGIRKALDDVIEYRNENKYVIKADIVKFFDNINRDIATKKFKREFIGVDKDLEVVSIFERFIYCEADLNYGDTNHRDLIKKYLNELKGKGVRQGMPIASLCSSMYLYEFDNLMIDNDISYIRYADDFLVFSNSYEEIKSLKVNIKKLLYQLCLSIEKPNGFQKTQIYGHKEPFSYLGFDVICLNKDGRYVLKIPNEVFRNAKQKLNAFNTMTKVKRKLKNRANYAELSSYFDKVILGYTNYYSEKVAINGREFKKSLKEESIKVRKKLISDNLNINFDDIGSANKRMFFFGVK